jgi:tetrahydromethanopterin S-methyltransferase subunit F
MRKVFYYILDKSLNFIDKNVKAVENTYGLIVRNDKLYSQTSFY